jgi:hypothetical protein
MSVLKLPLLVDLQQKVGKLVLSITSCPPIIILDILSLQYADSAHPGLIFIAPGCDV